MKYICSLQFCPHARLSTFTPGWYFYFLIKPFRKSESKFPWSRSQGGRFETGNNKHALINSLSAFIACLKKVKLLYPAFPGRYMYFNQVVYIVSNEIKRKQQLWQQNNKHLNLPFKKTAGKKQWKKKRVNKAGRVAFKLIFFNDVFLFLCGRVLS